MTALLVFVAIKFNENRLGNISLSPYTSSFLLFMSSRGQKAWCMKSACRSFFLKTLYSRTTKTNYINNTAVGHIYKKKSRKEKYYKIAEC